MPALAGVKNTNKRSRPFPTTSAQDNFPSTTPSNNPPQPQRRRPSAPTVNRTVDQSLFGDKHKHTNLKQQIRSISRLLNKPNQLDPALITRKQTELRILNDQLVDKQRRDRVERIDRKYKMVKFIERQKVVRRMRTLHRRLTSLTSTSREATDEEKAIRAEMERVQADLDYIDYYPKGTKYIALFASSKAEADEKGKRAGVAAESEEEDSDSELVVGGKHSKPQPPKLATVPLSQPDTNEQKTTANDHESATTPSTALLSSTPPPTNDAKAADRAAELEAQRAAIRESIKKGKAKATAGDKKGAAAPSSAGGRKDNRRKEFKDDFFVFDKQEKDDEQREDDGHDGEEEGEQVEKERRDEGKDGKAEKREGSRRDGQQMRNSRDGAGRQNGREQRGEARFTNRDERRPFRQEKAERTNGSRHQPEQQRKRRSEDGVESSGQPDIVGQQRSAYNPNKHIRVSEVKKTARKIVDADGSEKADRTNAEQRTEERKEAGEAEKAAGEETSVKRKRKRSHKKKGDKSVEQPKEAGATQQQQRHQQQRERAVEAQQSAGAAADQAQPKQRKRAGGRGKVKQPKAADPENQMNGAEEDERRVTKHQEAEIRDQRRQDVKSLLQLDDRNSDDEQ